MSIWGYVVVLVLSVIVSYALSPSPPEAAPPEMKPLEAPTAEAGLPIPVIFGTLVVESPNIVWYGDFKYVEIKSK